jgi:osmotically-inducible protein OsmY
VRLSITALTAVVCAGAIGATALADDANTAPVASRVSSALHSDPYLNARHIEVTIKDGNVVLTGFVQSDWELDKAMRDATEAAKPYKVIDALKIQEGGRR